jgi:predicted nucleotidyltransferase
VKTAYIEYSRAGSKKLLIPLRRRNESRQVRYTEDDFDLMCAIDLPTDRIWLIPFGCLRYQNSNYSLRCAAPFLLGEGELDISDVAGLTEATRIAQLTSSHNRKASFAQAEEIRAAYDSGVSRKQISLDFNLCMSSVSRIIRGESHSF